MKIIGLTGGIATGKTTVAQFMEQLGAVVIDADQLSRDVVAPGSLTLSKVVELFGPAVLSADGRLDRQAMRRLVFSDTGKRQQLEAILHPAIKQLALQRLAAVRDSGAQVAVYMAPLLIEAGDTEPGG